MKNRTRIAALICIVQYFPACALEDSAPGVGDARIAEVLRPIRAKYGMPAMAAAFVTSGGLVAQGAAGFRKTGEPAAVEMDDLWHLGSETKAMTAALAGRFAESGKLAWDATMASLFPALADGFDPAYREVTVRQLLQHRAGLEPNLDWRGLEKHGTLREQRVEAGKTALGQTPRFAPGSKYEYANTGYVIVGAALEAIADRPWEEIIQEELFAPLGMTQAGFGGTGTPGELDEPWPHLESGRPARMNGPATDNAPVLGPAGTVHCRLEDWAKFVADQLRGARGEAGLLAPETYAAMQTPAEDGDYGFGWVVTERGWAGGVALTHAGSNTMNYANVWIAPQRDFAILVCTNRGGDEAFKATDAAVAALIAKRADFAAPQE